MSSSSKGIVAVTGLGVLALLVAVVASAPSTGSAPAPARPKRRRRGTVDIARLRRLSARTGLPVPVLYAISVVESRGNDAAFRFEPHVFARLRLGITSRSPGGMDYATLKAQTDRDGIPYTPVKADSPGKKLWSKTWSETNSWAAFQRAYAIHPQYAIRATSWGRYQTLGWTLLRAYPDPDAAIAAFRANPATASDNMLVAWMQANPAARKAAHEGDWQAFARIYNGSGNVDKYAPRLASAHAEGQDIAAV